MKKCPFCAEEIQEEAVKCKHCHEYLDKSSISAKVDEETPNPRSAELREETGNGLLFGLIILIPLAILIYDFIMLSVFKGFIEKSSVFQQRVVANILYVCLGIVISLLIYRKRWCAGIIVLSSFLLFAYRIVFVSLYDRSLLSYALANTLREAIPIYASIVIACVLFRRADSSYESVPISNVVAGNTDPVTKKVYDSGTCGKCGKTTKIASERMSFLPKNQFYFCDNCGAYIGGNPVKNILLGIVEATSSALFFFGLATGISGHDMSTSQKIFSVILLLGIFDGLKNTLSGIRGAAISRRTMGASSTTEENQ